MKTIRWIGMILIGMMLMACNNEGPSSGGDNPADLSTQEQAELVAAALSSDQGGIGENLSIAVGAADGEAQQQLQSPSATYGLNISVNIDFYDAEDNLQEAYDQETTDRIDYEGLIQGEITNGVGFFTELSIDNQTDFTVDDILTRTAWINGIHTNRSSYSRIELFSQAEIHFELDCSLTATDVTVDLDAGDCFPESGTIEGSISGSYERIDRFGHFTSEFSFSFIATYLGDNTAEIELGDGTVFIVQLVTGSVQNIE